MNRPTRIKLEILLVLSAAFFWSTSGRAQEGKTAQLLQMYRTCVFDAVQTQVRNSNNELNASAATEFAFQACRTEEQAILAHASAGGVTANQANQVITDYKLSIKQQVRKAFVDAVARPAARHAAPALPEATAPRPGCSGSYTRYDGATVHTDCR